MAISRATMTMEARRRWSDIDWHDVLLIAMVVLAMALLGIATRPLSSLASFWPANAVLLALWIRFPRLLNVPSVIAAMVCYVAADLVTGSTGVIAVWLAVANLAGALAGVLVARRSRHHARLLVDHQTIPAFLLILVVASLCAAAVGSLVAPDTIDTSRLEGLGYWFSTEFANYMVVAPIVLLIPMSPATWIPAIQRLFPTSIRSMAPVVLLVLAVAAAGEIGGSGAIAIPVPFMIWCALAYGLGATVIVNFGIGVFFMFASTFGWLGIEMTDNHPWSVISLRLGLSLLTLGPLALAIVNRERSLAVDQLRVQANHDALTGLLNRRAFLNESERLMETARAERQNLAVLMLDIDHFKRVNDTKGHRAGDHVLVTLAEMLRVSVPESGLISRYGGEEFVAMFTQPTSQGFGEVAETVRREIEQATFRTERFGDIHITVSGGLVISGGDHQLDHEALLDTADIALYRAKDQGRNRIATILAPSAETSLTARRAAHALPAAAPRGTQAANG